MISKKATKEDLSNIEERMDGLEKTSKEYMSLAVELKDIVLDLNSKLAEMDSLFNRIKDRLGL
tara:strand:+ start:472 stop:660 length:189 start_codon:yes stop_codon:yes gene_type:complete